MTSMRVFHLKVQSLFKRQSIVFSEYLRQSIVFPSIFYLDRCLWEQKVAKESESFVATFGRNLSSITLFVHARYGARKVLCTGLMGCGGVLVQNSKVQVTPTRGQKIEHAAPHPRAQSTWHAAYHAQRPARPTNQYGTQSGGIQQSACAANRTHARTHLRSSKTCSEVRRSVRLR